MKIGNLSLDVRTPGQCPGYLTERRVTSVCPQSMVSHRSKILSNVIPETQQQTEQFIFYRAISTLSNSIVFMQYLALRPTLFFVLLIPANKPCGSADGLWHAEFSRCEYNVLSAHTRLGKKSIHS